MLLQLVSLDPVRNSEWVGIQVKITEKHVLFIRDRKKFRILNPQMKTVVVVV